MEIPIRKEAVSAIVKRIEKFCNMVRKELENPPEKFSTCYASNGRGIHLTPILEAEFAKIVDLLAKQGGFGKNIPREVLSKKLMFTMLNSNIGDCDSIEKLVQSVINELQKDIKSYNVYIPLGGLILESGKIINFSDIEMKTFSDDHDFDAEFRARFIELQRPDATEENIRRNEIKYMEYLAIFKWRPSLVFKVYTGIDKIRDIAFDRVQPIADFWQFCIGILRPLEWRSIVDYRLSAVLRGLQAFPVIADDKSIMSFPCLPGGVPAVSVTERELDHLSSLGILALTEIFGTLNADVGESLDALIRRAIQNFAEGERATSQRQKLLAYTMASELFFTRKKDTTVAVCHGIARILSKADSEEEEFRSIYGKATLMYEARSRTIHDGVTPVVEKVLLFRHIALGVVLEFISRRGEFNNKNQIEEWCKPPPPRD